MLALEWRVPGKSKIFRAEGTKASILAQLESNPTYKLNSGDLFYTWFYAGEQILELSVGDRDYDRPYQIHKAMMGLATRPTEKVFAHVANPVNPRSRPRRATRTHINITLEHEVAEYVGQHPNVSGFINDVLRRDMRRNTRHSN